MGAGITPSISSLRFISPLLVEVSQNCPPCFAHSSMPRLLCRQFLFGDRLRVEQLTERHAEASRHDHFSACRETPTPALHEGQHRRRETCERRNFFETQPFSLSPGPQFVPVHRRSYQGCPQTFMNRILYIRANRCQHCLMTTLTTS